MVSLVFVYHVLAGISQCACFLDHLGRFTPLAIYMIIPSYAGTSLSFLVSYAKIINTNEGNERGHRHDVATSLTRFIERRASADGL